uniref:Uncharacterized protein n=1 Tax=Tanacetum cinerariifolium TaxID=118510 RepID=A0A6L2NX23_TANCI|nr:hypothetical protein [Tanacetum cinerariifolium]
MAYFVAILTPDSAWSCVMQCTFPTERMRSIISMVSISLKGFMPSILLLVVIIVAVVIVAVILVVVVIDAIVGVVIAVASIGVVVVMIIRIVIFDGVFLLGLSAFAMAAACASRAAATPSVISCRMVASIIAGIADVDVLLGAIYQHIHANTEYTLRHGNNGMSDPIKGLDTKSSGDIVDLIGDEDPSDEVGDTEVSVSLGEISLEENKYWESNIGDCDNTRDGGKTAGRAIITWGGRMVSYACMTSIFESSCKGEKF